MAMYTSTWRLISTVVRHGTSLTLFVLPELHPPLTGVAPHGSKRESELTEHESSKTRDIKGG